MALREITVHQLQHTDFYISAAAGDASVAAGTDPRDDAVPHRIDFFAIVWFTADGGSHFIDFEPYPVQQDLVYLLARNQVHALPPLSAAAKVIMLSKSFFDSISEEELRFLFAPFSNEGIAITAESLLPITQLFELMQREHSGLQDHRMLHRYLSAFLAQLRRLSRPAYAPAAEQRERLILLFQLLAENYKKEKLVQFYADAIGITAKRLNQIVKEQLDLSVSQLIYNFILIEAKREISHGSKSMKEIAIDLGFTSQSYFSRFFRKQTGTSPENFR